MRKHHAALAYGDVPTFLKENPDPMLRLLVLTGVRVGDVTGDKFQPDKPPMAWEHVDLKSRVWTIPCTKTDIALKVPLTDAMINCLGKPGNGDVFADAKKHAKHKLSPLMKAHSVTLHGFRSAFRDWAAETQPLVPKDVVKACLAHANGNKVDEAYQRSDLLEQRRSLMDAWSLLSKFRVADALDGWTAMGRLTRRKKKRRSLRTRTAGHPS
jgi:integrase